MPISKAVQLYQTLYSYTERSTVIPNALQLYRTLQHKSRSGVVGQLNTYKNFHGNIASDVSVFHYRSVDLVRRCSTAYYKIRVILNLSSINSEPCYTEQPVLETITSLGLQPKNFSILIFK
jgi:hypothetical protein